MPVRTAGAQARDRLLKGEHAAASLPLIPFAQRDPPRMWSRLADGAELVAIALVDLPLAVLPAFAIADRDVANASPAAPA